MYVIKFHLKVHRDSCEKYSLMTVLNVIKTCMAIMQEIFLSNLMLLSAL